GAGDHQSRVCRHHRQTLPENRERTGVAMTAYLMAAFVRLLTGVRGEWRGCAPETKQRIYFANHTSNLDGPALWASLPEPLRVLTRPVAARDYWSVGRVRPYLAEHVLNAL